MTALMPCGTYAAYDRHLRYHQVPCGPCYAAKERRDRAQRAGRRAQRELFRELLGLIAGECRRAGMLP